MTAFSHMTATDIIGSASFFVVQAGTKRREMRSAERLNQFVLFEIIPFDGKA